MPTHPQLLLESIRIRNLLSFGPEAEAISLRALNVIIGPNASGKSNFINVMDVLRSIARDYTDIFNSGFREWLWKWGHGIHHGGDTPSMEIEAKLGLVSDSFLLNISLLATNKFLFRIGGDRSAYFDCFKKNAIFRDWDTGRYAPVRSDLPAETPGDFLLEDLSNLAVVLRELKNIPTIYSSLLDRMRQFHPQIVDIDIKVDEDDNYAKFSLVEEVGGIRAKMSARRLSDGTLRYLCLVVILCHPDPPPLICLEEPEIGLHPDLIPKIAEMLVEASQRTQLIVTTHSEILVDALTDTPEAILVCEKDDNGSTRMRRLEPEILDVWLEHYRLGELWQRGDIGGNRW